MILSQETIPACKNPQVSLLEELRGTWSEEKLLSTACCCFFIEAITPKYPCLHLILHLKWKLDSMHVFKPSLHPHYMNTAAAFGEHQVPQPPLGRTQAHTFLQGAAQQMGWPYFLIQAAHLHLTCTSTCCKAFPRKAEGIWWQPEPCLPSVPMPSVEICRAALGDAISTSLLSGSCDHYKRGSSSLHAYYFPVPPPGSLPQLMKACNRFSLMSGHIFCNYPLVLSAGNY